MTFMPSRQIRVECTGKSREELVAYLGKFVSSVKKSDRSGSAPEAQKHCREAVVEIRHQIVYEYVRAALSPAEVISVTLIPDQKKACSVIVPDGQLSLAIGKEGQNARLAARLTGCKIDIKAESQAD